MDCYRSIINKIFEFYNLEAVDTNSGTNQSFLDKDILIEKFKTEILAYLNRDNAVKNINQEGIEYEIKYYQGMNDLIIFFVLLRNLNKIFLQNAKYNVNKIIKNKKILEYITKEKSNHTSLLEINLWNLIDFILERNFKPFCLARKENYIYNQLSNLDVKRPEEKCDKNSLKMKKILPTVIKYIEIIDPLVKRRLFDLIKIEPFYSLSWILTWFSHNNENILKNFRIFDYLILGDVNKIFYLTASVSTKFLILLIISILFIFLNKFAFLKLLIKTK